MVARMFQFVGGHKRWLIVIMLAGFGVVNYLDRQGQHRPVSAGSACL